MNSYRFNQIAMAVLGALLLIFGTRTIMQIAFEEHEPAKPGHEAAKKPAAEKPAGGGDNILALIATADPAKGAEVAKKCQLCHSFDKGGPNLIGPDLYGVLGRKIASHEGYEYSEALKKIGGDWGYLNIDQMIEHPNVFAPGTKMALFQGLPDAKQRAEVIAFLRTKNDNPPPLPDAKAAEAAPAEAHTGRRSRGRRCRWRGHCRYPREGRCQARRRRRQEMPDLPQLRQRRPEPDRPEPLRRAWPESRVA